MRVESTSILTVSKVDAGVDVSASVEVKAARPAADKFRRCSHRETLQPLIQTERGRDRERDGARE